MSLVFSTYAWTRDVGFGFSLCESFSCFLSCIFGRCWDWLEGWLGAVISMISMFMLTMLSSVEEEDLLSLSIHNYKEVVSIKAYVEFISHDGLNKLNLLHWWNGKMLKSQQQR
jgi:hypothetical protein